MNASSSIGTRVRLAWVMWRNRLLSSPRFQLAAARFPGSMFIARRRAAALFDLVAGFTYSQILAACIETRLLEELGDGVLGTAAIAARIDLPIASAERLLLAAGALGLVERIGEGWALGSVGAALLGNSGIAEMVAHHRLLYDDLADPVALLRRGGGGRLSELWPYARASGMGGAQAVCRYSALMAASQPMIADQVIDAYPFHRHRALLDVGGGEGAFLTAVGARVPGLSLRLFDLPAVGDRARERFASVELTARTKVFGGDFLKDPLPRGQDIVSLVRVLHDHDDDRAMTLLRAVHASLPPGGTVFIAEPMAGTRGAERAGDAYFGFYLLAMGSGRPRRPKEIAAMLRAAGFSRVRLRSTALPIIARIMTASR